MNRTTLRAVTALSLLATAALLAGGRADAVVTARWVVSSYQSFDKGEGESVLITSEGEVKPGWSTERTELEVDASWSAARLADGSIVLGTDEQGALYRVSGGAAKKLATLDGALAVVSLAVDGRGAIYAGTMPDGAIWKVDARTGKARKLVALPDVETVWSLAVDHAGKRLYAGTGPHGKLFVIDPASGKAKVAFATGDLRIMALAATDDGAIWLGTSEDAVVFRYDPKRGAARAMADFDGNEVTALAAAGSGVVAAANKFTEPTSSGARTEEAADKGTKAATKPKGQQAKLPKAGTKPGADKALPTNAKLPRKGARKGKGALYRIGGDSRLEQLHALTDTYFTSVAVDPTGRVFAGAGDKGRIYLVDADDAIATAFDVSERQVAQVIADERGIAFATADGAAAYRATGAASKAAYTSEVEDTKASSKFGRITWRGAGTLKLETRSGNTAEPGIGWSGWAAPANRVRGGGQAHSGRITSPPGRYLQYRVTFDGDADAVLRSTTVYHLPQNRPTTITEIDLGGAKKIPITKSDAAKPRSPVVKVKWKIDNPDKDDTVYTLAVRREGEVRWRRLVTKDGKPITKTEHPWNTETFPDGHYQLRITASDHPSNADDRALRSQRTTPPFALDNTKPALSGVSVTYPRASARATDALSAIAKAAYSIDDGPWQLAGSDDGLFDRPSEILTFRLPRDLPSGVHTFAIRAADEAGNIGSASVTFRVR